MPKHILWRTVVLGIVPVASVVVFLRLPGGGGGVGETAPKPVSGWARDIANTVAPETLSGNVDLLKGVTQEVTGAMPPAGRRPAADWAQQGGDRLATLNSALQAGQDVAQHLERFLSSKRLVCSTSGAERNALAQQLNPLDAAMGGLLAEMNARTYQRTQQLAADTNQFRFTHFPGTRADEFTSLRELAGGLQVAAAKRDLLIRRLSTATQTINSLSRECT